jgi:O-antigen/teichoic acid export membrane protein
LSLFKRNILASYASQIYVMLIGIVILPMYIRYMGAEAYGLVGFFAMLQMWFQLLDLGLAPTMARETARFNGGATDALSYRRLIRALQAIYLVTAVAGGGAIFAAAGWIAGHWLRAQTLPLSEVKFAVQMMALCVAMRWMAGLYRSAISGSERLVWLGGYNAWIATLRFVGVLPVLMLVGASPTVFFTYQFLVAITEVTGLAAKVHRLLPAIPAGRGLGWSFAPLKPVLTFSLTIAFTSSAWVLVTQTDKLVLSKLLSLANYGYFTLAVLVASAVMQTTGPITAALIPRMARLEAEGNHEELIRLYRNATQLVGMIAMPIAFTLAAYAEPVIWAWTGDKAAAQSAAPILQLYAIGYAFLALSSFPSHLQVAKGDLKLHLVGNVVFIVLLVPSLIVATMQFGGVGAGYAWLISHIIYFLAWVPLVHRRFVPGLHRTWLSRDVLPFIAVSSLTAFLPYATNLNFSNRFSAIAVPFSLGLIALATTASASSAVRVQFQKITSLKFVWR